ncbi:MAG TPA: cytochrome b/b6 domain-containing protein [Rhizobiaceae bacterium]|nr:cytochrome b/b6 domain-containing protein [Rhizobiaceae bacterium]
MAAITSTATDGASAPSTVKVWDPFVRLFHWSLVVLFIAAFVTGDEWGKVHEPVGYAIAVLVALRIAWGFVGPRHARFADFVTGPGTVLRFLRQTAQMRAPRHLGHNPAGGAMVLALIATISAISATGYMMTTDAFWGVEWVEEAHEAFVWVAIALVVAHVAGVVFASLEHRENLVRSMFTGRKRAP